MKNPVNNTELEARTIFKATLRLMDERCLFAKDTAGKDRQMFPYIALLGNRDARLNNDLVVGIA